MCGIIGYTGENCSGSKKIYEGLKNLEYRGYDSCGMAVLREDTGRFVLFRAVGGTDELLKFKIPDSRMGIGHTRWATHGGVTVNNAHPHYSFDKKVYLTHNGVIENSYQIKQILESKNIPFYGICIVLQSLTLASNATPSASDIIKLSSIIQTSPETVTSNTTRIPSPTGMVEPEKLNPITILLPVDSINPASSAAPLETPFTVAPSTSNWNPPIGTDVLL